MLTVEQAKRIKVGDVVLVAGRPRIVRDVSPNLAFTFSILHKSWTGRILTVRNWNDLKHILALPRRSDAARVALAEHAALAVSFDVVAGLRREISEKERMNKVLDRPPTPGVLALARKALACAIKKAKKVAQ
jgi:hypothetical protein